MSGKVNTYFTAHVRAFKSLSGHHVCYWDSSYTQDGPGHLTLARVSAQPRDAMLFADTLLRRAVPTCPTCSASGCVSLTLLTRGGVRLHLLPVW